MTTTRKQVLGFVWITAIVVSSLGVVFHVHGQPGSLVGPCYPDTQDACVTCQTSGNTEQCLNGATPIEGYTVDEVCGNMSGTCNATSYDCGERYTCASPPVDTMVPCSNSFQCKSP